MQSRLITFLKSRFNRANRLYATPDPWHLETPREQFRFAETNRLIAEHIGEHFASILEVGCGEGHQTQYLEQLANKVYGVDISARAISRATRRCPQSKFSEGDIFTFHFTEPSASKFDLVTAFEVLHYLSDDSLASTLEKMCELGAACMVSYVEKHRPHVDPHIRKIPGIQTASLSFTDTRYVKWEVAWWKN
jgi:2-polyprenyl-3-methyl-5-hydroxy-6-metoxy-1,4-benzoquinol methylase